MAKIFSGQNIEAELLRRTAFPKERHINVRCKIFCLRHEFSQARLGKTQQHIRSLDFAALAV